MAKRSHWAQENPSTDQGGGKRRGSVMAPSLDHHERDVSNGPPHLRHPKSPLRVMWVELWANPAWRHKTLQNQ